MQQLKKFVPSKPSDIIRTMAVSKLDRIMPLIAKVVDGEDLSAKETEQVFTNIFLHDFEGFHFVTFIAAIHAKGETPDELLGLVRTHEKLGVKLKPNIQIKRTTDLSGSGGGTLKTFNVSTTASFVVAAAGYVIPKQAFYGVTSPTGSADVFAAFGVNIAKLTGRQIEKTLESVGICPIFYPFISPKLTNRGKVSRKVLVEKRVQIMTPFHLVSNITPTVPLKRRIYGLYSERYLETLGELFAKLGYERTLTFHGVGGLPEISNIGKTVIVEQRGKKLKKYTLKPSDLGVKKAKPEQIKTGGKEQNIIDFIRILQGKERGARSDLTAINAAAALYIMGETESLAESVPKAQELVRSGEGFRVLEKLVKAQGELKLLKRWLTKINAY